MRLRQVPYACNRFSLGGASFSVKWVAWVVRQHAELGGEGRFCAECMRKPYYALPQSYESDTPPPMSDSVLPPQSAPCAALSASIMEKSGEKFAL